MGPILSRMVQRQSSEEFKRKWGAANAAVGFTMVPNALIERMGGMQVSPVEFAILVYLLKCWWTAENDAFPGKNAIADAVGIRPRSVQRRIAAMESRGLVLREERRAPNDRSKTNKYSLKGLVELVRPHAEELAALRAEKKSRRTKGATPSE